MKEEWIDTRRNLWYLMIDNVVVKGVIALTISPVRMAGNDQRAAPGCDLLFSGTHPTIHHELPDHSCLLYC